MMESAQGIKGYRSSAMRFTLSQGTKLLLAKTRLLENFTKGSARKGSGMHCHVGLPPIWVPQDFVAPFLSYFSNPVRSSFTSTSRAE